MEAKTTWRDQTVEKNDQAIPLTMATPGKEVTVIAIDGGKGIRMRLYAMGITPGVSVRILNNGAPGPFLLAVRDSKIAIGYGMAQKMMVK